jgi:hypothetical protein
MMKKLCLLAITMVANAVPPVLGSVWESNITASVTATEIVYGPYRFVPE